MPLAVVLMITESMSWQVQVRFQCHSAEQTDIGRPLESCAVIYQDFHCQQTVLCKKSVY